MSDGENMSGDDKNISTQPETPVLPNKNSTMPPATWKDYIPAVPKTDDTYKSAAKLDKSDNDNIVKTPDDISASDAGCGPVVLEGSVEKHGHIKGGSEQPRTDERENILKGSAKKQTLDPDASDRELLIAWDAWRNTVIKEELKSLRKLLGGWDGMVYNRAYNRVEPRFPSGLAADTIAEMDAKRQITKIELLRSSGDETFDKLVIKAISKLNGKKFLAFPTGSRRTLVGQESFLKTCDKAQKIPTFLFNDFEHVHDSQ